MARYLPLFSVQLAHDFFGVGNELPDAAFQIEPSKSCAESMKKENLLIRTRSSGIEVWREQFDFNDVTTPFKFEFLLRSKDPYVETYTAWEMDKPFSYSDAANELGAIRLLKPRKVEEQDFGLSSFERQRHPVLCSIHLQHTLATSAQSDITQYKIQLHSKAMHWKYYFSGALAKKKLTIVDLDAESIQGVRFIPSSNVVTENSLAFVSEAKLPMRSIPTQRFQLREEDATGRVLMRRLPNASINKIGKERGPDGQSLVVAEIYIHQ